MDAFAEEARPWALRQAQRTYGHLPRHLTDQAVRRALLAVRAAAPAPVERRVLGELLAEALSGALQEAHTAWCLESAPALPAAPGGWDAPGRIVADFLRTGLGGLERAVLQLEMGGARDSASARAALRLGPVQYRRLRERGLAKLRAAVAAALHGQVCDQHLDAVALAATGDPAAAKQLAAGPGRCRSCARQARGVGGVLRSQLALAPWPLAIKPAGFLAAKLGALGALTGSGGAGGGVLGAAAKGVLGSAVAKGAAVVVAAAVATGGAMTATSGSEAPETRGAGAQAGEAGPAAPLRSASRHSAARGEQRPAARRPRRTERPERPPAGAQDAPRPTSADEQAAVAAPGPPRRVAPDPPDLAKGPVDRLAPNVPDLTERPVDRATRTAGEALDAVPVPAPAGESGATLDGAARALDGVLSLP